MKKLILVPLLWACIINGQALSETQKQNARATGYAIVAAKNPGVDFSIYMIPWDGVNSLENNANSQINPSWHAQAAVKGEYFDQTFDNTPFTGYSSVVTSQEEFDKFKSTGTQWWIVCSTLPSYSSNIYGKNGNIGIGTINPVAKLHIETNKQDESSFGDLYLGNTELSLRLGNTPNYSWIQSHAGRPLFINKLGNNTILNKEKGNVGIGVEDPLAKLHIATSKQNESSLGDIFVGDANANMRIGNTPEYSWIQSHASRPLFINTLGNNIILNKNGGNVGIGMSNPQNKLDVNGTIHAKEVKIDMSGWADFVFQKDYPLPSLEEIEKHINEKGHLANIPTTKEIMENGLLLGENQKLLLQKIEELTLYTIEQYKLNKIQSEQLQQQIQINKSLEQRLHKLEKTNHKKIIKQKI
ncbi:hypothetical protein [Chryseobacterium sp. c4a]|uniref:hypothetical protein n=1 Tax=Chryseobacterium sp. c4a TaxID=1573582 RepID=UPI001356805D|nr:hypothetical protein [Chryseobacterium sp. c4a]